VDNLANQAYIGQLAIKPVGDGVHWELLNEFGFSDRRNVTWMVPQGAQVDGASIPQALWSIIGSPLTGKYVEASVIHDYHCDVRARPCEHVHRVFYEAMLVSGVSELRAKVMYAAVYFAGPRWSGTVVHNVTRDRLVSSRDRLFSVDHSDFTLDVIGIVDADGRAVSDYVSGARKASPTSLDLDIGAFEQLVERYNPSIRQIAEGLDTAMAVTHGEPKSRKLHGVENLSSDDGEA
jgi:hypothetical protein